jgi:hypothetical protein
MTLTVQLFIWTFAGLAALSLLLTFAPRAGGPGKRLASSLARAPGLDIVISLLTWAPWVVGAILLGWTGLAVVILAQAAALSLWVMLHEAAHPRARRGPRIVTVINRTVGRAPNHLALWISLLALPGFLFIRISQILFYPPMRWLIGFPRYRHAEWINVSRQKFEGLIGHDLIWCLYCDWMTGVYALGGEMLRNVESFWCPIRYYDGKKCENCRVDFPDIDGGWVAADGTMAQVQTVLEEMYGSGRREWFGHPVRLTTSAPRRADPPSSPEHAET